MAHKPPTQFITLLLCIIIISCTALYNNTVAIYSVGLNILKNSFLNCLTYNFVHVSFLHLILNSIGLWYAYTELRRIGHNKGFIALFVFIGLFACCSSVFLNPPTALTAGCSGSILGIIMFTTVYELIGAHGTIFYKQKLFTWCCIWLVSLAIEINLPLHIDHYIHLAGTVIGGLLGFVKYNMDNYLQNGNPYDGEFQ
jgi:membrane associated rhomboid family serine protease